MNKLSVFKCASVALFLNFLLLSCQNKADQSILHFNEDHYYKVHKILYKYSLEKALSSLDSIYRTFNKTTIADKCKYYHFRARLFTYDFAENNNAINALTSADEVISIIENNNLEDELTTQYTDAYDLKSNIYNHFKLYPQAFKATNMCKLISEKFGDPCSLAQYTQTEALIYFQQELYDKAIIDFKKALSLAENCQNDQDQFYKFQGFLDNLGLSFFKKNQPDSALKYFEMAEQFINKNRSVYKRDIKFPDLALAVVFGNISKVYAEKENYPKAIEYIEKSIAINSRNGFNNEDAIYSSIIKAQLLAKTNNITVADNLLSSIKSKLSSKYTGSALLWLKLKIEISKLKKDKIQELVYINNYYQVKDSISRCNIYLLNNDPKEHFEQIEKKNEVEALLKNNKIQQIYIISAILAGIILLLLAYVTYKNLIQTKKLAEAKEQINVNLKNREKQLEQFILEREKINEKERIDELFLNELRLQLDYNNAIIAQRLSISNDMHDGLSSSIVALRYFVTDLSQKTANTTLNDSLNLVNSEVASIYENTREYMHNLKKDNWNEQVNLIGFLHDLSQRFSENNLLKIEVNIDEKKIKQRFSNFHTKHISNIIREIISNTLKYAQANKLIVSIQFINETCFLKTIDNGKGFDINKIVYGIGFDSIQQRVSEMNGTIEINSKIGSGTDILVEFTC